MPADRPVTRPEEMPMDTMAGLAVLQVPPGVGSVSVVLAPWQIRVEPDMLAGSGFTVMVKVASQLVPVE
jgi:hypothetical protein